MYVFVGGGDVLFSEFLAHFGAQYLTPKHAFDHGCSQPDRIKSFARYVRSPKQNTLCS